MHACRHPRCPNTVEHGWYCAQHKPIPKPQPQRRSKDTRTTTERGYGAAHVKMRMHVLYRDQVCCFCGGALIENGRPVKGATRHHIIPLDEGGPDTEENSVGCHWICHERFHRRIR